MRPLRAAEIEFLHMHVAGEGVGGLRGLGAALAPRRGCPRNPSVPGSPPRRARSRWRPRARTAAGRRETPSPPADSCCALPLDRVARHLVHVAARLRDRLVVVALHRDRAFFDVALHRGDDRLGIGAVARQVAEKRVALRAGFVRVPQAGVERLEIRVHVGQECEDHAADGTVPGLGEEARHG